MTRSAPYPKRRFASQISSRTPVTPNRGESQGRSSIAFTMLHNPTVAPKINNRKEFHHATIL